MIDLRKLFAGSGYLFVDSPGDTTNLVCRRGHIYADGKNDLVAALDGGTVAECSALQKLGVTIMDCDFGELSVRFSPTKLRDAARILHPRQVAIAKSAA